MERGSKANKEEDYAEATDCFSRALEIRDAHYGERVRAYYKHGCALLYKAQEEYDPLVSGAVSKKEVSSEHLSKNGSAKGAESGEASVSSDAKEVAEDGGGEEEDDEGSDVEEDESVLDLAWKMLNVAREIAEKQLSALERDFKICLCLKIGSKGEEPIPYCQKAISVCKDSKAKSRVHPESAGLLGRQSSSASQTSDSVVDKEKEI